VRARVDYFTNVYTVETWAAAQERGNEITGFPAPTQTRGGYFESTFEALRVGDVLLCYVKAPAKRWVGALTVEGEWFFDYEDAIWGHDAEGRAAYPARFRTAPSIALPVERGLPVERTIGVLRCMREGAWSGIFRRSLTRVPPEDAEMLLKMLAEPRDPSPIRMPRRRPPRPVVSGVRKGDLPSEDDTVPAPATRHAELVSKLIRLGKGLGCDVWVASDERRKSFEGHTFANDVLSEFPAVGLDPESRDLVRSIDVLWIRGRAVLAAFEVEATTSVYSGLLRMSDLVALQPNTSIDLFIVAPEELAAKVGSEILRPTFESFDLLQADLVVADLTEHNPNVLFELGMRMHEDKPVALVRARGTGQIFDVDNMLRVEEYSPNLWPSTVERDVPKIAAHIKATWENRASVDTFMRILRRQTS
jgi:hypothetical protein